MSDITAQMVKDLRDRTGVGMAKCKDALVEANGDLELAIDNLRKAGVASAVKKEGRETKEGVIKTFENDTAFCMVEINSETDFVAKNEKFQEFVSHIAKEICHTKPTSVEDFLKQKYSRDPNLTVEAYRALMVQGLGENIKIRRFEIFPRKKNSSLAIYSHSGGKLVTLVEIAGSDDEMALAKDIAMHVAAAAPEYLSSQEIPERVIQHEKEIARAQIKGKPENIVEKILEGKLKAFYDQVCLLNQKYVKDPNLTVSQLVEERAKEIKKPLQVTYFVRWKVGT